MVYLVQVASNEGFLGGTKDDQNWVVADLLRSCGWNDRQQAADAIMRCIEVHEDQNTEHRRQEDIDQREQDRMSSIYVDLDDNLNVLNGPSGVSYEIARKYITDARIAVSVIRFLESTDPTLSQFIDSLPRSLRDESYETAAKMVRHVRAASPC